MALCMSDLNFPHSNALRQFSSLDAAQSAVKSTFLASAIRKCGGNEEKGNILYSAYGSSGQVCRLFASVLFQLFPKLVLWHTQLKSFFCVRLLTPPLSCILLM